MRTQDEKDEDRIDALMDRDEDESRTACSDCGRMVRTTHTGPYGPVCGACLSAYLPE